MFTVALLTALAASVHDGALKPPVFSATFGRELNASRKIGDPTKGDDRMVHSTSRTFDGGGRFSTNCYQRES